MGVVIRLMRCSTKTSMGQRHKSRLHWCLHSVAFHHCIHRLRQQIIWPSMMFANKCGRTFWNGNRLHIPLHKIKRRSSGTTFHSTTLSQIRKRNRHLPCYNTYCGFVWSEESHPITKQTCKSTLSLSVEFIWVFIELS